MSMSSLNVAAASAGAAVDRAGTNPQPVAVEAPKRASADPVASTPTPAQLEQASAEIEKYVQSSGRNLQFRVDADSGRVVVSVRDADTGELIRQIPNEAALRIAKSLEEGDQRRAQVLIDDKA